MEVEELFKGIAVIIDDEINDESSPIFNIRKLIEKRNIPVLTYAEIPSVEIIEAFQRNYILILGRLIVSYFLAIMLHPPHPLCDNYITSSIQKYAVLSHFRGKKSAYFLWQ